MHIYYNYLMALILRVSSIVFELIIVGTPTFVRLYTQCSPLHLH